jgi:hypothetical protein
MTWLRKLQVIQVLVAVAVMFALFVVAPDNWIEGFIDSIV